MPHLARPAALQPGDRVRIVSPASPPGRDSIALGCELLRSWGLEVEVAPHVFDEHAGFLAGTDDDRLADLNDALSDPAIRAVFASRGGKGAYRIVDRVNYRAIRADPKLLVGFSEVTILHLAILQRAEVPGLHGPFASWDSARCGPASAELLRRALMTAEPVSIHTDPSEATASLTTAGTASGALIGGNLDMIRTAHGSFLPDLTGAILLIEDPVNGELGRVDRSLHQLRNAGALDRLAGVAVGQFGDVESGTDRWTIADLLGDLLRRLSVPVLGGLPLGHGPDPATVPIGTTATIDADVGTLVVDPATRSKVHPFESP